MAERGGPRVYSIAAHRGFADALVAGLMARSEPGLGLARLTLLLPSTRAIRTVTEAFVRQSASGLLLPRMVAVGDLALDESLGALFDPLGTAEHIPAAVNPTFRWLRLAAIIERSGGKTQYPGGALLRQAYDMAQTMDRLLVEGIAPEHLQEERVVKIVPELSKHWQKSTDDFVKVQRVWLEELCTRGEVDAATRRNMLFDAAAQRWSEQPPVTPIIAAGVTSSSPALARLLRVIAELPGGAVVLPDLDLQLDEAVWHSLGNAGKAAEPDGPEIGAADCVTHPQYHLKLLLNRMGIARDEVQPWHRAGLAAAPPERSRAISNLFLPPLASATWASLAPADRRLRGLRLLACAHPEEEAQALAILIRQALEVPERRVALVTPDRSLAMRVVAHLQRWGIAADDSAGQPLSQLPAGRLLLLIAQVWAESAAPVPLIALLGHPLVAVGQERPSWLDAVRKLDLRLRGPRLVAGLEPLSVLAEHAGLVDWWTQVAERLGPLPEPAVDALFSHLLAQITETATRLCGDESLWSGVDGRALSAFLSDLAEAAEQVGTRINPRDLPSVLRDAMDRVAVRPPWGGHPRVAIYGLLESRMVRADLLLCGGMVEGMWPAGSSSDALLPPAVLRTLGVPGGDFRIGLSAHDLAAALGAPEVVLSWPERAAGAPTILSRFVLRIRALLGDLSKDHIEEEALQLAKAIDRPALTHTIQRPEPVPSAEQRRVDIAVTALDRLRSDPYQFYASSILRLRSIDPLDAEPSAAWRGTMVHAILEQWHKAGAAPGTLLALAEEMLEEMAMHPLTRGLWRPRLMDALSWIDAEVKRQQAEDDRHVLACEVWGSMIHDGVRVHGRADRIDRLADGSLAIVDYKSGHPPKKKMVEAGYALQLGLIGLIAERGGFDGVMGVPERFEYWSLAKQKDADSFGYLEEPIRGPRGKTGPLREDFLPQTAYFLSDAIERWITGVTPFTARLNPDLGGFNDYDQLMRLDEWLPNLRDDQGEAA